MGKKSRDRSRGRKAQITIFIILGVIIAFVSLMLIMFSTSIEKEKIEGEKERVFSGIFSQEGLRFYVEDCLTDELSAALILIGKQGRLWNDQQGGIVPFDEGKNGIYFPGEEGSRVFYGITEETYTEHPNAYPCNDEEDTPIFCEYSYPNVTVDFGQKPLLTKEALEGDLRRFLTARTLECVEEFAIEEISEATEIKAEDLDLDLDLLDDGISVKAKYPITFIVHDREYFSVTDFDIFYPTDFFKLVEQAVLRPLKWDHELIDFSYDEETLLKGEFKYGKKDNPTALCSPFEDYYLCDRTLRNWIDFDIEPIDLENGDEVFTFSYKPIEDIVRKIPEQDLGDAYELRIARKNRPPALDYVGRKSCPADQYDFLAIPGSSSLNKVNIKLSALDPDEDEVSYELNSFSDSKMAGFVKDNELFIGEADLLSFPKNIYTFKATASDNYLEDWQDVRVLIDRPMIVDLELNVPYKFSDDLIPYEKFFQENKVISIEDPVFLDITIPDRSEMTTVDEDINLKYTIAGTLIFNFDLPEGIELSSTGGCFSFPWLLSTECGSKIKDYNLNTDDGSHIIKNWLEENLNPGFTHFGQLTEEGKLEVTFTATYCKDQEESDSVQKEIKAVSCLPHRNPLQKWAYPYHIYQYDESGNYVKVDEDANPFLATHSCCHDDFTLKEPGTLCFESPVPGCSELIKGNYPEFKPNLILEKKVDFCSGQRGNVCGDGSLTSAELWDGMICGASEYEEFTDIQGCDLRSIPDVCEGKRSWGYTEDGWCHGTMGCTQVCRTEVVDVTGRFATSNYDPIEYINSLIIGGFNPTENQAVNLDCGCKDIYEGQPCDNTFDGRFNGVCVEGECK